MTLSAYLDEDGTLVIERDGEPTRYHVRSIPADPRIAWKAYKLIKADGTTYEVAVLDGFPSCTCGDEVWRREPHGETCKHWWACKEVGLFDEEGGER